MVGKGTRRPAHGASMGSVTTDGRQLSRRQRLDGLKELSDEPSTRRPRAPCTASVMPALAVQSRE